MVGSVLFLARAYGVEISSSMLVTLAITIILLSLGAPGVPGSIIVCIGVALGSVGVPLESVGLIMCIASIADMFVTMSNTTGDVACALIVSKQEGVLDVEKYNS